ncbi:MAG: hypothetical protein ACUVQZ_08630 [Candidatus Caldatribacteriaceae bacterium]
MNKLIEVNNRIKSILNVERGPVGVKFLKEDDLPRLKDRYDFSTKMRYCQALRRAGKGEKNNDNG